eukprot:768712-Hanusia_phi.AAC.7
MTEPLNGAMTQEQGEERQGEERQGEERQGEEGNAIPEHLNEFAHRVQKTASGHFQISKGGRPSKQLQDIMRGKADAQSSSSNNNKRKCSSANKEDNPGGNKTKKNNSNGPHHVILSHSGYPGADTLEMNPHLVRAAGSNANRPRNMGRVESLMIDDNASNPEKQAETGTRVIDISYFCHCDDDTFQFVTDPLPFLDDDEIRACFLKTPSFKWKRKEFVGMVEDLCRKSGDKTRRSLWGNDISMRFTVGGSAYKPEAVLDRVNSKECLQFMSDGPDMMFTIISKNLEIDSKMISVLKILSQMQNGGKRECITSFVMPTKTTNMNYRGDNKDSKAMSVIRKLEKSEIENLHMKLKESNQDSEGGIACEDAPDNGYLNYKILVNCSEEEGDMTFIEKQCLEARMEMRMIECDNGESKEVWVAQSIYVHTVSGVNPYTAFLDIMNQMPRQDQRNVNDIFNFMDQYLNESNIVMKKDLREIIYWITQPCMLCQMVTSWAKQKGLTVLSSDIPLVTEHFINVILARANRNTISYLNSLVDLMNNCKAATKSRQNKFVADSTNLFRGAYLHPEFDKIVFAPLPPATFSFVLDLNINFNGKVGVFELTDNCIFARIFNVICNPKLDSSELFMEEMENMEASREFLQNMRSIEGMWVNQMINNVMEQRDMSFSEIEPMYLKIVGKHAPSNKNYADLLSIAFKRGSIKGVDSTMNLIIHQLDDFAFYTESVTLKNVVEVTKMLGMIKRSDVFTNSEESESLDDMISENFQSMLKRNYSYRCIDSMSMQLIQDYLVSLNMIFQLSYTNLNLIWVLLMSFLSYSLPLEPAWATCIMVVDAACQPELISNKKSSFLAVAGEKSDSTGFNFVQASFTQLVGAINDIVKLKPPDIVSSNFNFSDGKLKRMGFTVAMMNNKERNEENTTHVVDYGKVIFVSEDCDKMLSDTGTTKNYLREGCEKKDRSLQGVKNIEHYNMKLSQLEEARLLAIASNTNDSKNGEKHSVSIRIRYFVSSIKDNVSPMSFKDSDDNSSGKVLGNDIMQIEATTDLNFAMKHNMMHILPSSISNTHSSNDINTRRTKDNIIMVLLLHLSRHVEQIITLGGFYLNCNQNKCVSEIVFNEINNFIFRLMGPFISVDMNNEERFIRKQKGLMLSYAVPLHVVNTVHKKIMAELFKIVPSADDDDEIQYSFDCNAIIRESVIDLLYSDINTPLICSSYHANITFDTTMYVLFRAVIRVLEFPNNYSLSSLIRLVKFGKNSLSMEEIAKLDDLRRWIQNRMNFFVTNQDLIQSKVKQDAREISEILSIDDFYPSSTGGCNRSIFLTDPLLYAKGSGDEEQVENKNMWTVLKSFILSLPEIQNAQSSFRLRSQFLTHDMFCLLFNTKILDRSILDEVFGGRNIKITDILVSIGVEPRTIPQCWNNMSLYNVKKDEGNKNANVFNMILAGQSCALSVNLIALLLVAPMLDMNNVEILHQLEQKNTITNVVKLAMEMRVPRIYWPSHDIPTLQVDGMGRWVEFNMQGCSKKLSKTCFNRINDILWNNMVPSLATMKSFMKPFFLEEIHVCSYYVNICKKKIDGMDVSDKIFTCDEYFDMISINSDQFPFQFPRLTGDGDYSFIRIGLWCLVSIKGDQFTARVFRELVDEESDEELFTMVEIMSGSLDKLYSLIYMMQLVPFPLINHTRLVYCHSRVKKYYSYQRDEDFEFCDDFGVLVQHDDGSWCNEEGSYLVQYTFQDDLGLHKKNIEIGLNKLHRVLVPELGTIYVNFEPFASNIGDPGCRDIVSR